MIEEVIKEITDAEAKAKQILETADKKVTEIMSSVALEVESLIEKAGAKAKTDAKKNSADAEKEADKTAQEFIAKEVSAADALVKSAADKIDKAVDFIIKGITG